MQIINFKAINKSNLVGFAEIVMPSGIGFVDVTIMRKESHYWAMPPTKPVLVNGAHKTDPDTNKPVYAQIITFSSKELKQKWSDAVIAALKKSYPEVFEQR